MADYRELATDQPFPEHAGNGVYGRDAPDENLNYEAPTMKGSQTRMPQMQGSQARIAQMQGSPRIPEMQGSPRTPEMMQGSQTSFSQMNGSPRFPEMQGSQTSIPQMQGSPRFPQMQGSQTRISPTGSQMRIPQQGSQTRMSPHGSQTRIPQQGSQTRISQMQMQMPGEAIPSYRNEGPIEPQSPLSRTSLVGQQAFSEPMMRQAYAMPAAGLPARHIHEHFYASPAADRQYKMASDIFGTGMDRSWNAGSTHGHMQRYQQNSGPQRSEPTSFKITESADRALPQHGYYQEPASAMFNGNRRTRESPGNPLTGLGYDGASTKTAKRYFEGSNANSKLW